MGDEESRMIVGIQQPEHGPWLGFFNKMAQVDCFVLLDDVQFKKRYFENRNRIRGAEGAQWLTVPVVSKGRYEQYINEVAVDEAQSWRKKYLGSLQHAYGKAGGYGAHYEDLKAIIERPWQLLAELNIALIDYFVDVCRISRQYLLSSSLDTGAARGSDLILEICRQVGASVYVSGPNGSNYLDLAAFADEGIRIVYHEYEHPEYEQLHPPFMSHMSIIDALFCAPHVDAIVKQHKISI
jgi:hypothetical protein